MMNKLQECLESMAKAILDMEHKEAIPLSLQLINVDQLIQGMISTRIQFNK